MRIYRGERIKKIVILIFLTIFFLSCSIGMSEMKEASVSNSLRSLESYINVAPSGVPYLTTALSTDKPDGYVYSPQEIRKIASYAIDCKTSSYYPGTNTKDRGFQYWQLELPKEYEVEKIVIYNKTDKDPDTGDYYKNQLDNSAWIRAWDKNKQQVFKTAIKKEDGAANINNVLEYTLNQGSNRVKRVNILVKDAHLALAEVQLLVKVDSGSLNEIHSIDNNHTLETGYVNKGYDIKEPWGLGIPEISLDKYPLIISLHSSGASKPARLKWSKDFSMRYPAFIYAPYTDERSWEGVSHRVISEIDSIINEYNSKIDINRVYIIGHSMGGAGSFYIAKKYYNIKGKRVAGIIRSSGQSGADYESDLYKHTSIWYNFGSLDIRNSRDSLARDFFIQAKNHFPLEKIRVKTETPFLYGRKEIEKRVTKAIIKDDIEIVKLSEYVGMGHDATFLNYAEDQFQWLFNQTLVNFNK